MKSLENKYAKALNNLITNFRITVITGFSIVAVLILFGLKLGSEFLPELDEGSIFLRGNFPAGITIQENAKYAPKIRETIAKYPQISYGNIKARSVNLKLYRNATQQPSDTKL